MENKRRASELDRHAGRQLRKFRMMQGISQIELAEALGISFQQVQKYERATNRIPAGRLKVISDFLGEPLDRFFPGEIGETKSEP